MDAELKLKSNPDADVNEDKEFPSGLVIICMLILIAAVLTYVIPAGEFTRYQVAGRTLVQPGSYHQTAQKAIGLMDIFKAVPQGFLSTSWICFLILIVGGVFNVVTGTGAIQAALQNLLSKAKDKDIYFIPVIVFLFSIIPTLMGTLEAYLAFVPLGVMIARSMGLDALVGISMIVAAGGAGLASGITNPFNIGIAQAIVGLPVFSAMWFRILAFIGFNLSVSFWTLRYAKRIKEDPRKSYIYKVEQKAKQEEKNENVIPEKLTGRLIAVLLTVFACMAYVVYTAVTGGDFKIEIPAVFLIMLFIIGFIMKYSLNDLFKKFSAGAQGVVSGVLIVGFAKAIAIILENSGVVDTIINAAIGMLDGSPKVLAALIMYLIGHIGNFFIISDAGLIAVTVPILSPIGDLVGLTQQTVCAAAHFGGAIGNLLLPTSPLTAGAIAMADVDYPTYFKYIITIILTNTVIAGILVAFAAVINLGPF